MAIDLDECKRVDRTCWRLCWHLNGSHGWGIDLNTVAPGFRLPEQGKRGEMGFYLRATWHARAVL
jgi:hypothetical protein